MHTGWEYSVLSVQKRERTVLPRKASLRGTVTVAVDRYRPISPDFLSRCLSPLTRPLRIWTRVRSRTGRSRTIKTPRTAGPLRIRIVEFGSGVMDPKTMATTPTGNSIVQNFFLFASDFSSPNGRVQELPRREIVVPAPASQTPVSKEDVTTTFEAAKRNRSGELATNSQTRIMVRRPPYLDSSAIIPPATTKNIAKEALTHKDGYAA